MSNFLVPQQEIEDVVECIKSKSFYINGEAEVHQNIGKIEINENDWIEFFNDKCKNALKTDDNSSETNQTSKEEEKILTIHIPLNEKNAEKEIVIEEKSINPTEETELFASNKSKCVVSALLQDEIKISLLLPIKWSSLISGGETDPLTDYCFFLFAMSYGEHEFSLFWLKRSASKDFPTSQQILAQYYLADEDYASALYWFAKGAVDHNIGDCYISLSQYLLNDDMEDYDPVLVENILIDLAEEKGEALYFLALMHLTHLSGFVSSKQLGFKYIEEAVQILNDNVSKLIYGKCLLFGIGTEQNVQLGEEILAESENDVTESEKALIDNSEPKIFDYYTLEVVIEENEENDEEESEIQEQEQIISYSGEEENTSYQKRVVINPIPDERDDDDDFPLIYPNAAHQESDEKFNPEIQEILDLYDQENQTIDTELSLLDIDNEIAERNYATKVQSEKEAKIEEERKNIKEKEDEIKQAKQQAQDDKILLRGQLQDISELVNQKYHISLAEIEEEEARIKESLELAEEKLKETQDEANEEARIALEAIATDEKALRTIVDTFERNAKRREISKAKTEAEALRFKTVSRAQKEYYDAVISASNERKKLRQRRDDLLVQKSKEIRNLQQDAKSKFRNDSAIRESINRTMKINKSITDNVISSLKFQEEIESRRAENMRKEKERNRRNDLIRKKIDLQRQKIEYLYSLPSPKSTKSNPSNELN